MFQSLIPFYKVNQNVLEGIWGLLAVTASLVGTRLAAAAALGAALMVRRAVAGAAATAAAIHSAILNHETLIIHLSTETHLCN
jgi:hypothetical protein